MVRRLTSLPRFTEKETGEEAKKTGPDTGNFRGQGAGQTPGPPLGRLRPLLSRGATLPAGEGASPAFSRSEGSAFARSYARGLERVPRAHPSGKVAWSQPPSPSPRLLAGEG